LKTQFTLSSIRLRFSTLLGTKADMIFVNKRLLL